MVHAVNDVTLAVTSRESVGVVGETGSGKSTMVRAILGLIRSPGEVTADQLRFNGTDLRNLAERHWRQIRGVEIGFIPQNPFSALSPVVRIGRQFTNLIRSHRSVSRKESISQAEEMLRRVGIRDPERVLDGYVHELSGGMAQRVIIAMVLILQPRLIVADEPTTALDVTVQRQILDLIGGMARSRQMAMLLVSHDLGVIAQYCDRVAVMYAGTIVEVGSAVDVLLSPAHPYTEALVSAASIGRGRGLHENSAMPNPLNVSARCSFFERCPYKSDRRCAEEVPPLREVTPSHWAATFCDLGNISNP